MMKTSFSIAILSVLVLSGSGCNPFPSSGRGSETPQETEKAFLRPFLTEQSPTAASAQKIGCDQVMFQKMSMSGEELTHPEDVLLKQLLTMNATIYQDDATVRKTASDFGLTYQDVEVKNGLATVRLTGQYQSGGICDDPRIPGIIEAALCQFPTVSSIRVLVNGEQRNFTDQSGENRPAKDTICRKEMYQGTEDLLKEPSPKK